jgi:hypothetical protein
MGPSSWYRATPESEVVFKAGASCCLLCLPSFSSACLFPFSYDPDKKYVGRKVKGVRIRGEGEGAGGY